MHRELRMVRRRRQGEAAIVAALAADRVPGRFIEIGVEPRQHHGAVRQLRDDVEEFGGRRHRAGRAGRDHRTRVMRGEPRGFRLDQEIAPRRGLDPADLLQVVRPGVAGDAQEVERVLPVFVELVRHQAVERAPVDAARHHVVHQPRQVAGELQCRGRPTDHQRCRHRRLGPGGDQMRQRQPALELAEPGRNLQRRRAADIVGLVGESELVLVDLAERDDARQHRGIGIQHVEKDFARQPAGAAGRQIQRGVGELGRIVARLESRDQPAIDQRRDDGAQEWHGNGNAENAHELPDSIRRQYRERRPSFATPVEQPSPLNTAARRRSDRPHPGTSAAPDPARRGWYGSSRSQKPGSRSAARRWRCRRAA